MIDIIKNHSGPILIAVVFTLTGATLGYSAKPDEDGVFLKINGFDGKNLITLGSGRFFSEDLKTVDDQAIQQLASNIARLETNHLLSLTLWRMAQNGEGPFKAEQVTIKMMFSDKYSDPIGTACQHSDILGKYIVATDASESGDLNLNNRGILGIQVLVSGVINAKCNGLSEDSRILWINRDLAESWLEDPLPPDRNELTVKANLVLTNAISFDSDQIAGL